MKKIIFLLCLTSLFSCDLLSSDEDSLSCIPPFAGSQITLRTIDGDRLPYYTVQIDNNNWSRVDAGYFTLYADGTWESTLVNSKRQDGISTTENIMRTGTYTCLNGGKLSMINDQNATLGELFWRQYAATTGSGEAFFEYLINIEGTVNYSFEPWRE